MTLNIENIVSSGLDAETMANVINELKTKWGENKITLGTIHLVLKECMELVEKLDCPGSEKKKHVLTIVKVVVVDLVDDENDERIILELIDKKVLENTMDLIVMATKGELNLNKPETQKKLLSCGKTFLPILISIVKKIIALIKSSKKSKKKSNKSTLEPIPRPDTPRPKL